MSMSERDSWQDPANRSASAGEIREDAEPGVRMHQEGAISTADIARGTANAGATAEDRPASTSASNHDQAPLFGADEAQRFQSRWSDIQTGFVDDPRQTVQHADALVAEVMKRLAEVFATERGELEQQWERGQDVSTEELRVALQRYRSFFGRLLAF
jgi:hypothetical protein